MNRKYLFALMTLLIFLASGICYSCTYHRKGNDLMLTSASDQGIGNRGSLLQENASEDASGEKQSQSTKESDYDRDIAYIHLCGAVAKPGVYQVESGTRLVELIKLAGGLTEDAASDYINQAVVVKDGERIYVPTKEELRQLDASDYMAGAQDSSQEESLQQKLVNINKADTEELMTLPGIGKAKADSIIKYRNENGSFKSIEEIMSIPGIKEGLFEKISSYITI